jgi:hypothetical protein
MAERYGTGLELENEPAVSIDFPVVRKKFRVTIDVEATLAAGPPSGELPPAPESVQHTKALVERLLTQPGLVERLLRCRAVEAARRAGKALEAEYGWGGASEHELLDPIFAELELATRAYFTEELEDGVSAYYFDGYGATIERASITEID